MKHWTFLESKFRSRGYPQYLLDVAKDRAILSFQNRESNALQRRKRILAFTLAYFEQAESLMLVQAVVRCLEAHNFSIDDEYKIVVSYTSGRSLFLSRYNRFL